MGGRTTWAATSGDVRDAGPCSRTPSAWIASGASADPRTNSVHYHVISHTACRASIVYQHLMPLVVWTSALTFTLWCIFNADWTILFISISNLAFWLPHRSDGATHFFSQQNGVNYSIHYCFLILILFLSMFVQCPGIFSVMVHCDNFVEFVYSCESAEHLW